MKYEIRASVQMTVGFTIEAEDDFEAEERVKREYLKYVEGGRLDNQAISIKTRKGDTFDNCWIMECNIEDCNEVD